MNFFETVGKFVDGEIQQFHAWFATQPDEGRLTAALVIGAIIGVVLFMSARKILRVLVAIISAPFAARTPSVVVPEPVAAVAPVVPADHFHDPLARFGVMKNGSRYKMVQLPQHLGVPDDNDWSWELVNVDYPTAVSHMLLKSSVADGRCEILPPPSVQSRPATEGETLSPAAYVYVVSKENKLETIPATADLADNVKHRWLYVIGNKMLESMANELIAKVRAGSSAS